MTAGPQRGCETGALTDAQARLLRLRGQGLANRLTLASGGRGEGAAVVELARALVGVQAQEPRASALALRARSAGLVASDIEHALVDDRTLVRTWCLRGTLHLVASADLHWLLALLGPALLRAGRRRRAELGLDAATGERGVRVLSELLTGRGPLTRAEIAGHLAARGLPAAGQATIHLIGLAALQGAVCYGPSQELPGRRDREPTFVALPAWLPAAAQGEMPADPVAELARRYLAAYAPAVPADLAHWSGLSLPECRAAWQRLAPELVEVRVRDAPAWLPRSRAAQIDTPPPRAPVVNLVPGYDPYLLGYHTRELAVLAAHARRIHPGGGLLHPTVLVDGLAAGTWRLARRRARLQVEVEPFGELDEQALVAEIEDVERFLAE